MRYLLTAAALLACVSQLPAREPTSDDARRLAARIDDHLDAALAAAKVRPAPAVEDAGFYRRASLDLAGRIPSVSEARRFLADKSPEKRVRAVEALLDSPGYANHMTNVWADLLLPEARSDIQNRVLLPGMQRWLRNAFAENKPYDKLAHELVALPMPSGNSMQQFFSIYQGGTAKATPMSYYFAKKGKAEDMAAGVARVFLGVRLECAQCHDHPSGSWTREQFWSQAAFFAGFKPPKDAEFINDLGEAPDRREMSIPNTDRISQAKFLDGKQPRWKFKTSARATLADWMVSKDNAYFSKAAVNRVWANLFGTGIVDPVDDLVELNRPSHPELLDMLAREFAANDFDLKFLVKAIVLTRAYQRASYVDDPKQDVRLLGYVPMRGLTAEQTFESLSVATGYRDQSPLQNRLFGFGSPRAAFMEKFGEQEKRTEYHTSIPQALTMMNNQIVNEMTDPDKGPVLGGVASSSFMTTAEKVEALVLAALSRKPTADESRKFLDYVRKAGPRNERKALSDVYWALLNSTEFKFNH